MADQTSDVSFTEEFSSSEENESTSEEEEEVNLSRPNQRGVIQPYQFEPLESSSDESDESHNSSVSSDEPDEPIVRRGNRDWCRCNNCAVMATEHESICCRDQELVSRHITQTCITEEPFFEGACLNIHALFIGFLRYNRRARPNGIQLIHEQYRYVAYRSFIVRIYHQLGAHVRRPIPSCVVSRIIQVLNTQEIKFLRK